MINETVGMIFHLTLEQLETVEKALDVEMAKMGIANRRADYDPGKQSAALINICLHYLGEQETIDEKTIEVQPTSESCHCGHQKVLHEKWGVHWTECKASGCKCGFYETAHEVLQDRLSIIETFGLNVGNINVGDKVENVSSMSYLGVRGEVVERRGAFARILQDGAAHPDPFMSAVCCLRKIADS